VPITPNFSSFDMKLAVILDLLGHVCTNMSITKHSSTWLYDCLHSGRVAAETFV